MSFVVSTLSVLLLAAPQQSPRADQVQQIIVEYDKARADVAASARAVKTIEDRKAIAARIPNTLTYSRRLLDAVAKAPATRRRSTHIRGS